LITEVSLKTVYIVGFDEPGLARVRDALPSGHSVLELPGAEAALAALESSRPDAVVVNFPQPLRDGRSLTAALRSDPRTAGVPVVAVSGWNYRRTRETAVRLGCAAFLPADSTAVDLERAFRRALGTRVVVPAGGVAVQANLTGAVAGSNVA
jgi:two-component system, cell cycle response regulator DivK